MKKIILVAALIVASICASAQTKKELNAKIVKLEANLNLLESKVKKLESEKQLNESEIVRLNNKIAQTEQENTVLRNQATSQDQTIEKNNLLTEPNQKQRCKAITQSGSQCSRNAQEGSEYCFQHVKTYDPKSTSTKSSVKSSSGSSTGSGRTIYTGPKGGKYYINSSGKKVYVKK